MVALERIREYADLQSEAPEIVEPRPPAAWPEHGVISVDKLVVRYAVSTLVNLLTLARPTKRHSQYFL